MPKQTKTLLGIPVNGKSQEEINMIIDNLGLRRLSEKSLQMLRSFPEDEREFYLNHSNAIQPFTDSSVKEWFDDMNSPHDYTREDLSDLKKTREGKSKATGLDNMLMSFSCNGALKSNILRDAGSFIIFFKQEDDVRDKLLDRIDSITYDVNSIFGLDPDHNDEEKIFVSKQMDDDFGRSALVVSYTGFPNVYGAADDIKKLVSDAVPEARVDHNAYAVLESQMKNIKERYSANNGKWVNGKNIALHSSLSSYCNSRMINAENETAEVNKAEMLKKGVDYIDMFARDELKYMGEENMVKDVNDEQFLSVLKSCIKTAITRAEPLTHVGLDEITRLHNFEYSYHENRIYFDVDADDMSTAEDMRCTFSQFAPQSPPPPSSPSIDESARDKRPYKEKEKVMEHCVLNTSLLPAEDDEKDDYPELGL